MTTTKTLAVLVKAGAPVALSETSRRSGEVVAYGFDHVLDTATGARSVLVSGHAKISRARKYLSDDELIEGLKHAEIKEGGAL